MVASAEFLGPHEEHGWELAGKAAPVLYVLWSFGSRRSGSPFWSE
jgi:hypothetical protein